MYKRNVPDSIVLQAVLSDPMGFQERSTAGFKIRINIAMSAVLLLAAAK
jgi:hypothetical protein